MSKRGREGYLLLLVCRLQALSCLQKAAACHMHEVCHNQWKVERQQIGLTEKENKTNKSSKASASVNNTLQQLKIVSYS